MAILVTPAELSATLDTAVVLDVRWALGVTEGRSHYRDAHIPGAVFVDMDSELAGHGDATDGRHPLPEVADLQESARRWGIGADSSVVVYDATGNLAAARAWWLLRWAGVRDVRLLDGGLSAWIDAELPTRSGDETAEPGDVELRAGHLPTMTADDAESLPEIGILLDARAAERYRGEVEPVDPRAGHIPGALSAPTSENLAEDGRFADPQTLRERFAAWGIHPGDSVGVYCGSGVTASHQIAALAIAGIDGVLYPGSWSAWSSDPQRSVATGADPGR